MDTGVAKPEYRDPLSPLQPQFWDKYLGDLQEMVNYHQFPLKPWDPSFPPANKLRCELEEALQKFGLPQPPSAPDQSYDQIIIEELLAQARKVYNNKNNPERHPQSLVLTYKALWLILSEEPLHSTTELRECHSRANLTLLANGLVLWDKNSAWLGLSDTDPLSTLRITSYRMWIYRHGIGDNQGEKTAVRIVSTLAYALKRLGRWAGALECLRWALDHAADDEATKRDLRGALAGILDSLEDYKEAIEQYQECKELDEALNAARDARVHRKASEALLALKSRGPDAAAKEVNAALKELKDSRHIGFQLQFFRDLADYYIIHKRFEDAKSLVADAIDLLKTESKSYHKERMRFQELEEYLDLKQNTNRIFSEVEWPVYELVETSEELLLNNRRLSATVLLATALESITLAMWLARKEVIKAFYEQVGKKSPDFPEGREWEKFKDFPNLAKKNRDLYNVRAYDPHNIQRNKAIFELIDTLRNTRNSAAHGHSLSEKIRSTTDHIDDLYLLYKHVLYLVEYAHNDIKHYHESYHKLL